MNRYTGVLTSDQVHAMRGAAVKLRVYGADADDVLQEVAVELWLAGVTDPRKSAMVMRRRCIDYLRKRLGRHEGSRWTFVDIADTPEPEAQDDLELSAMVDQALRSMPEKVRGIVELVLQCDTKEEVAEHIGLNPTRVSQHLAALRSSFGRFLPSLKSPHADPAPGPEYIALHVPQPDKEVACLDCATRSAEKRRRRKRAPKPLVLDDHARAVIAQGITARTLAAEEMGWSPADIAAGWKTSPLT